jgi:AcrR family transcriptional regulator
LKGAGAVAKGKGLSEKKIAILDATLGLVAKRGFHQAPTSEIAERAGVGMGSLYRYFADKDELIRELFAHVTEQSQQAIIAGYDPEAPFREQYIQLCCNVLRHLVEYPDIFRFVEQYLNSPYGIAERREKLLGIGRASVMEGPLDELFQRARARQVTKDIPLPAIYALTFGPLFFLIRDVHAGLIEADDKIVRQTVEACWDAVKR